VSPARRRAPRARDHPDPRGDRGDRRQPDPRRRPARHAGPHVLREGQALRPHAEAQALRSLMRAAAQRARQPMVSFVQALEAMRYHVLAADYDGTLAHRGRVDDATWAALHRLGESGRKLVLVTGRELDDVLALIPEPGLFARIVAENGALVYRPAS